MRAPRPDESALQKRLTEALAERDEALTALGKARAELEALRLQRPGEPNPPHYPVDTALEAPPLRYVVVDALNERVKGVLGPVHEVVRAAAAKWGRRR